MGAKGSPSSASAAPKPPQGGFRESPAGPPPRPADADEQAMDPQPPMRERLARPQPVEIEPAPTASIEEKKGGSPTKWHEPSPPAPAGAKLHASMAVDDEPEDSVPRPVPATESPTRHFAERTGSLPRRPAEEPPEEMQPFGGLGSANGTADSGMRGAMEDLQEARKVSQLRWSSAPLVAWKAELMMANGGGCCVGQALDAERDRMTKEREEIKLHAEEIKKQLDENRRLFAELRTRVDTASPLHDRPRVEEDAAPSHAAMRAGKPDVEKIKARLGLNDDDDALLQGAFAVGGTASSTVAAAASGPRKPTTMLRQKPPPPTLSAATDHAELMKSMAAETRLLYAPEDSLRASP